MGEQPTDLTPECVNSNSKNKVLVSVFEPILTLQHLVHKQVHTKYINLKETSKLVYQFTLPLPFGKCNYFLGWWCESLWFNPWSVNVELSLG